MEWLLDGMSLIIETFPSARLVVEIPRAKLSNAVVQLK
jgi:hypothetical protein